MINIEALGKRFGDKVIFSDITITLPDRGVVRLLGDSGSGKTTLLRIIAGLDPEYSGKITHDGKISFAFQEYRLFNSLTAKENVLQLKTVQAPRTQRMPPRYCEGCGSETQIWTSTHPTCQEV